MVSTADPDPDPDFDSDFDFDVYYRPLSKRNVFMTIAISADLQMVFLRDLGAGNPI